MTQFRNGLVYRILWSVVAALICASAIGEAFARSSWSYTFTAFGWALLAPLWFLTPLVITAPLAQVISKSAALALGPSKLRMLLGVGALLLLLLGFVIRVWNGA